MVTNFPNWTETLYMAGNKYVIYLLGEDYDTFGDKLVELDKEWKYVEAVEEYLDLEEGWCKYLFIFEHLPAEKLYGTIITLDGYEDWEQDDLDWSEYSYSERVIRDYYKKEDKNAEEHIIPSANDEL